MYAVIYFLLFILVFLINCIVGEKKYNFLIVFTFAWFFFGALSSFGLMGIRKPSMTVHVFVMCFVLIIDMCMLLISSKSTIVNNGIQTQTKTFLSSRYFKFFQVLSIVLLGHLIWVTITRFLSGYDMSAVRLMYYNETLTNNPIANIILKSMPMGILNALVILYAFYAFETGERKYLGYSFINELLLIFLTGGRGGLFDFFILILLMLFYYEKEIDIKLSRKTLVIGTLIIIALICVSKLRNQNFLENSITYFTGSFSFLDYIFNHPATFNLEKRTFGYLTFGILIEPVVLFLKYLGITDIKVPSYYFNSVCQNYYNIGVEGKTIWINNNTTCFFMFYKDFGFVGIVFAALLFGFIISKSFKSWKMGSARSGLFFFYFATILIDGIMSYKLIGTTPLFELVTFVICTKSSKDYLYSTKVKEE